MRYNDILDPPPPSMVPPGSENKVIHTSFHVGDTTVMASDDCRPPALSGLLTVAFGIKEAEADRYFNALADGGNVQMPLTKTFWSPRFGMLTDRFGVGWMVNVVT